MGDGVAGTEGLTTESDWTLRPPSAEWESDVDGPAGVFRAVQWRPNTRVHLAWDNTDTITACGRVIGRNVERVLAVWRDESDRCMTCVAKAKQHWGSDWLGPPRPRIEPINPPGSAADDG